tara:strand:+ start:3852 stop:4736 length:885 start_codon:yes stop_codon:yes gene_type:complete
MIKFKILIPCYNDWKSLFKLLDQIDLNIKEIKSEFSILIVNDCSSEKMPVLNKNYKKIKTIDVINMKINQGHTRCNATGVRYLAEKKDFDYLLLMDGDGEDRPEEIPLLVENILKNKDISVVATRAKRSEGFIFKLLYQFHKIITLIFTGKNMNFGHFSCLTKGDVKLLSTKKSLWSNFAGTVKRYISKLKGIPTIRGYRYFGPSKMPLMGLVIHSLSIIATFKYQVLIRSIFMIIVLSFFFILNFNIIFPIAIFFITVFCVIIFIISSRENFEELSSSQDKIDDVVNIHTLKL